MIFTEDYSTIYQIIDENYGIKYNKQRTIQKLYLNGINYISFDIKELKLDKEKEKKIRRCQYISIQQPLQLYLNEKKRILVFNDILDSQLSQDKIKDLTQSDYSRILVQLILVFNEFEHRNFNWQISDLSQLYYIDGILKVIIIDYQQNINKQDRQDLFKELIIQNFKTYIPHINQYLNLKEDPQLQNLLEYLFFQQNISSKQFEVEASYEFVISWLLNISNFQQKIYYTPFCIIKSFDTPEIIKKMIHNAPKMMIFKQKKILQNHKYYEDFKKNIDREIEISEKTKDYNLLLSSLFYIRILDKPFMFIKYYKYTLSDIFKQWMDQNQNVQFYKLKVFHLCDSFSKAIYELKVCNSIHRDLKPHNLFLEDWNEDEFEKFFQYQIIIADWDRSKVQTSEQDQAKKQQNIQKQSCNIQQAKEIYMTIFNSENTAQYDAPETIETLEYNIWQFGLICFTIANRGIFAGHRLGCRAIDDQEYNQYFSRDAIENKLQKENYPQEFLDLLANCLNKNYKNRPSPEVIHQILWKLTKKELEIQRDKQNEQTSQQFQIIRSQQNEQISQQFIQQ
ncbi:unnamed protein product [Paramecium primaurelia]|uniref:Protein kinase domain-containing protein n=1 Tax=Paramecium primaurelia TaxID=5886 RepID=A0A8S1KSW4_PARPR|nr:unnamed protein product [Paramecium primaurelia]